jgi:hypothetical protein
LKTAIDWLLLVIGAIAALSGAFMMWAGADIIQVERGWSHFIAGAALFSGGLVTTAVVWSAMRLRASLGAAFAAPAQEPYIEPRPVDANPAPEAPIVHAPIAEATAATVGTAAVAAVILSEFKSEAETEEQPAAPAMEQAPPPPKKRFDPFGAFSRALQAEPESPPPSVETPVASSPTEELQEQTLGREKRPTIDDLFTSTRTSTPPAKQQQEFGIDFGPADELEPPAPPRGPLPFDLPEEPAPSEHVEPEADMEEITVEPPPTPPKPERHDDDDWLAETARALDLELGRSTVSEPEPQPQSESAEAPAAEQPKPEAKVIGRYTSGDTNYVMFSDGSIEAQTPDGAMRFDSLLELRRFVEQRT